MSVANPAPQPAASTQAVIALVLGILSIVTCCGLLGPIAWYLGNKGGQGDPGGALPAAGQGFAQAGLILGILGTIWMGDVAPLGVLPGRHGPWSKRCFHH